MLTTVHIRGEWLTMDPKPARIRTMNASMGNTSTDPVF